MQRDGGVGADVDRRREPADEAVRAAVAAVVGEDRGQHRHPEHAPELADRVVRTRRLALLEGGD